MADQAEHVEPERDIKLLLEKHRALVDEVKAALKDELTLPTHDDIFILRYVLSYKNLDSSVKYIRDGLKYRKDNPYLEMDKHPNEEAILKYTCAGFHGFKTDGGPIQVIRAGPTNVAGLYENNDPKLIVEEMTKKKEDAYRICDRVTRETGRLTKQIVVIDLAGLGWVVPSQALISSQNEASAIAKCLYPQLLEKVIILNAPWFMSQLWKVATMVLSESLTGKVAMCGGTIAPGQLGNCPYAAKNVKLEAMPTFVGGTCNCPGGCVGGVANDDFSMKGVEEAEEEEEEEEAQEGEQKPAEGGGWFSSLW